MSRFRPKDYETDYLLTTSLDDSLAFRYLAAGSHSHHDTLARFRRRFLGELAGIFLQVLELASKMKLLKLDTISLDDTKQPGGRPSKAPASGRTIRSIRTLLCGGARASPSRLEGAFRGSAGALSRRHTAIAYGAQAQNSVWPPPLCPAQTDSGTGFRHHQVGDRVSLVPAAGLVLERSAQRFRPD